ncbi:C40 family peptidase [Actinoplanes sp. DH11]|uniref:C40 family peptidase n=1 Tax=Actinoplanes sp. DH11 TaxID=2857011 RepID=UPI001E302DBE|nr:C40 family peptidase [Actinoplanes sp. DH11]
MALAVIAPAVEPADHAAEAVATTTPQATPGMTPVTRLNPELPPAAGDLFKSDNLLRARMAGDSRVSRSVLRRPAVRPAIPRRAAALKVTRPAQALRPTTAKATATSTAAARATAAANARAERLAAGNAQRLGASTAQTQRSATNAQTQRSATNAQTQRSATNAQAQRSATNAQAQRPARADARTQRPASRKAAPRRVAVQQKRVTVAKRGAVSVRKTTRSTTVRRLRAAGGRGLNAVVAFARSQVGKRYVRGGEGPHGFDCSGFTKRAYARAGYRLPHSSGAQARRARTVPRSQARPGDLVVGPGHVGIYMGRGMMIDAGNSRTGVVYRKVYRGLRVARLGR